MFLLWLVVIVTDELTDGVVMGGYFDEIFEVWVGRKESVGMECEDIFALVRAGS